MAKDVFIQELERLVDGEVVAVVHSPEKGYERYYGLKIVNKRRGETSLLWFLRDEEGNGPGSFVVEDFETAEDFVEV